ncbi:MAG: GAF and ANTAR domain-containing protein [Streptosporangiaceae bacterium]
MLTERIARDLASIGRLAAASPSGSLHRAATLATRGVPGCAAASLVVWEGGEPAATAASHPDVGLLHALEQRTGEGPAMAATSTGEHVLIPDAMRDRRWPRYACAAVRYGVRSTLALPLVVDATRVTCCLHSARPETFDERAVAPLGALLGAQIAVIFSNTGEYEDVTRSTTRMRAALTSRAEIDQAKGIIMHTRGCDADEAFAELRRVGERSQLRVTEVARRIVSEYAHRHRRRRRHRG